MGWVVSALASLVIGFSGLAVIGWGWFFWLPYLGRVGEEYGRTWEAVAFAACAAVSLAVAWGLFRLQERISRAVDPRGRALPDVLYCQRCGSAVRPDAYACPACGGTRIGSRRPAAPSRSGSQ
jgi:hypothetical protein